MAHRRTPGVPARSSDWPRGKTTQSANLKGTSWYEHSDRRIRSFGVGRREERSDGGTASIQISDTDRLLLPFLCPSLVLFLIPRLSFKCHSSSHPSVSLLRLHYNLSTTHSILTFISHRPHFHHASCRIFTLAVGVQIEKSWLLRRPRVVDFRLLLQPVLHHSRPRTFLRHHCSPT
jgi:hypothetical protein